MRVVWKHHPLPMHADAPLAHVASAAAHRQGKFWEYHDLLFKNQSKLKFDDLRGYARALGLDIQRFEKDLNDKPLNDAVLGDANEANSYGATGTPAFFINGRFLSGAQPFEKFAAVINAELTRLNLPIPAAAQ